MKTIALVLIIAFHTSFQVFANNKHDDHETLKSLDASWEKAGLTLDRKHLASLLSEEFVWVHNHAGIIDTKADVLARIDRLISSNDKSTRSRISRDIKVIVSGNTGMVMGFTTVDRGPKPITYHFMRTYVKKEGRFYLLANQTMAIPDVK